MSHTRMLFYLEGAVISAALSALPVADRQIPDGTNQTHMTGSALITYEIAITGTPGVSFEGTCWSRLDGKENPMVLTGDLPLRQQFVGESLHCRIRQSSATGSLNVELSSSSGNRTRSRTQGAGSTIDLSIR